MDGLESTEMEDACFEFTLAEIMEMETLYKEMGEESPSQKFCQKLATSFSCSAHRTGKSAIKWEQVQSWFQDKRKYLAAKVTLSPVVPKKFVVPSDATRTNNAIESSPPVSLRQLVLSNSKMTFNAAKICQKPKGERVAELSELTFEAKSAKDWAWYDVASFLNYRVLSTGELEVRVRFAGFGNEQDEWVNVRRAVRERSIPLEPSECHRVKVGDLVLCFRETDDHALYSDARIVEVQRRIHDIKGCGCIFVVRFDYDNAEGKVDLSSICCRPT